MGILFLSLVPFARVAAPGTRATESSPPLRQRASRALFGSILLIFSATREASKNHDFLASLQNNTNQRINRPGSAPDRILDQFSWILGAILALIFQLFRKIEKTQNLAAVPCLFRFSMVLSSKNLSFFDGFSIIFHVFSRHPPGRRFWGFPVPLFSHK